MGRVDIDEAASARRGKLYIPNWFSVEVKTGVRKSAAAVPRIYYSKLSLFIRCCPFGSRSATASLLGSWVVTQGWTSLFLNSSVSGMVGWS